jgi:PAS domain-containing protein
MKNVCLTPHLFAKSLHPEDLKCVLSQTSRASQSQEPLDLEYRMIHRDGSLVWVHDQAILVNDGESGHQYWQGIMVNITERKQAEEKLREKERLLSEAQKIGRMGSWSYSIPTDILQYTEEIYRLFDVSAQEFQHDKAGLLTLIYAADQPKVQKWLEEIISGRQVKELDFRIFHKNGELRYIQTRGAVIFDSPATLSASRERRRMFPNANWPRSRSASRSSA